MFLLQSHSNLPLFFFFLELTFIDLSMCHWSYYETMYMHRRVLYHRLGQEIWCESGRSFCIIMVLKQKLEVGKGKKVTGPCCQLGAY